MGGYRFQKWYLDLITEEGDYLFCYLTALCFKGIERKEFAFTVARPRAPAESFTFPLRGTIISNHSPLILLRGKGLRFEISETGVRVQLRRDDFDLSLTSSEPARWFRQIAPLTIPGGKKTSIRWLPLRLRARMDGKLSLPSGRRVFQKLSGYMDFVDSNVAPFLAPVRRLFWGRFYSEQINASFAIIFDSRQKLNGTLFVETMEGIYRIHDLQIKITDKKFSRALKVEYPMKIRVTGTEGDTFVDLKITQSVVAIESNFFDAGRSKWSIIGNMLRLFARNPRGIKFFAKADCRFVRNGTTIKAKAVDCVSEYVRFS